MHNFAENTMNIMVSTYLAKQKMAQKCQTLKVKNWPKHTSKIGPSKLRNLIGPVFDIKNGQF